MATPKEIARRRHRYWSLIGVGSILVIATVAWQLNADLWTHHSDEVGQALIAKERALQKREAQKKSCSSKSPTSVAGILEIPKIALTAPVQQGTVDAVLNVAVGHDTASVWPGSNGTAVFNAHDVSYFLNIDHLKQGDQLIYETNCTAYDYEIQSHAIVTAGSPVYNTPGSSIAMITCWPTNALWFTPDRYVVTAVEVSKRSLDAPASTPSTLTKDESPPTVNAPEALINQGLSLTTNYVPMGSMTVDGTPSQKFTQSPGPLNMEFSALESYFGATKSLTQNQLNWWTDLAPTIKPIPQLLDATISAYGSALDVSVDARGNLATAVGFHTDIHIQGGSAPGEYLESVHFAIRAAHLAITSWTLTRT
jgi:LPXTG-site transpeptidase (sortase) family protein